MECNIKGALWRDYWLVDMALEPRRRNETHPSTWFPCRSDHSRFEWMGCDDKSCMWTVNAWWAFEEHTDFQVRHPRLKPGESLGQPQPHARSSKMVTTVPRWWSMYRLASGSKPLKGPPLQDFSSRPSEISPSTYYSNTFLTLSACRTPFTSISFTVFPKRDLYNTTSFTLDGPFFSFSHRIS